MKYDFNILNKDTCQILLFTFFLCALTKFRLLTETDPRIFLCGYEYTS